MSINRIDFGVIAASNEVSHVKAAEDSRPLMDRQIFQTQFNEEVDNQKKSVSQKKPILERQLSVEKMEKMAGNMMDRNGKPVDLRLSSGFDLKI